MAENSGVPREPAGELAAEVERLRAENDALKVRLEKGERRSFSWRDRGNARQEDHLSTTGLEVSPPSA